MKRAALAVTCTILAAGERIALAHHGADPTDELSLWQFLAFGALVALGFLVAGKIKKHGHRRELAKEVHEDESAR